MLSSSFSQMIDQLTKALSVETELHKREALEILQPDDVVTDLIICIALLIEIVRNPKYSNQNILTKKETQILAMAANTIFPPEGPIPLSGVEAGILEYINRDLARKPAMIRRLIRLLYLYVEMMPLIFGPEHTLFSHLNAESQSKSLKFHKEKKEGFDQMFYFIKRMPLMSLRVLLTMAYFANEDVQKKIGCQPNLAPFETT